MTLSLTIDFSLKQRKNPVLLTIALPGEKNKERENAFAILDGFEWNKRDPQVQVVQITDVLLKRDYPE